MRQDFLVQLDGLQLEVAICALGDGVVIQQAPAAFFITDHSTEEHLVSGGLVPRMIFLAWQIGPVLLFEHRIPLFMVQLLQVDFSFADEAAVLWLFIIFIVFFFLLVGTFVLSAPDRLNTSEPRGLNMLLNSFK